MITKITGTIWFTVSLMLIIVGITQATVNSHLLHVISWSLLWSALFLGIRYTEDYIEK